ncbi:MAG: chromosomal replication initiator protein DnaA [Planctomycetes bacterium]|nr:chromosomal replication initiator protein DnaA [Planctomycetota bacterium]
MQASITEERPRAAGLDTTAITEALSQRIGAQKYRIWFQSCARFTAADGMLRIGVANPFLATWLEGHFLKDIQGAAQTVLGSVPQIVFTVDAELGGSQRRAVLGSGAPVGGARSAAGGASRGAATVPSRPGAGPAVEDTSSGVIEGLRLTLETFVVGPSNELAYNAAKAVIREQQSPFNPLFIHGGYGVGKTHLLQGICHGVVQARPQTRWLYLSAEDFANQFVLALKTRKLEAFRRRMRQTDLLAIDDVHFLASKPSTQEEFLHTFNTISLAGKQVILVSDAHPKMIGQLSEKLVNRFVSGMVVKIEAPDLQTRCDICRQFATRMLKTSLGGPDTKRSGAMPESVIRFVAERVRTNVRELEGAVLKLIAYATLQNEQLSVAMAQAILAEHIERSDPMVHVTDIEATVGAYFGVTPAHLHSAKKGRTISLARHFSMYLTRQHTNMSSSEVGRHMGNKNHATVLVACKKVEEMLQRDVEVHWEGPAGNKVAKAKAILAHLEDGIAR